MGGSDKRLLYIPWKSEDKILHHIRLIPHIIPSLVTSVAAPMVDPYITEGYSTLIFSQPICAGQVQKVPPDAIFSSPSTSTYDS